MNKDLNESGKETVKERRISLAGQRLSFAFPYRFGVWFNKFSY
ncbi:hypothetical protein DSOL_4885 [Desulfosporosinus metallidurans]|uniref:Uncharacterized protein n=1 Tax=Desulfosporosinus metallidurans TaxID=1888891 RepID=A0A1Q8QH45_9FIRM|nr:hypothetical protein DSOL_4885 [Desulfosporosinus metallidurans]